MDDSWHKAHGDAPWTDNPGKLVVPLPDYNVFGTFLLRSLDKADSWTLRHSLAVAAIVEVMAHSSRGAHGDPEAMWLAGLLHDIGKLGIPAEILEKPGALDAEEFAAVKEHSFMGYRALHRLFDHWTISAGALHHHERYDGHGYPAGLIATDIPIVARLLAVADSYETMRSVRPYKAPRPHDDATLEIVGCSGAQYDPEVVRIFSQSNRDIEDAFEQYQGLSNADLHESVWRKLDAVRWSPY